MKIFVASISAVLFAFPAIASPSDNVWTAKDPQAFCRHDTRQEIVFYCDSLAALQTAVNAAKAIPGSDLTNANVDFIDALNKLDITSPRALDDIISATASTLALNSAISSALKDAGQSRPDQQLSPGATASGTTSLVSKAGSAELLSLALNTGAVTESVNGTTATLTTNGDQIFRLVTGNNPDCTVTCNNLGWFENHVLNPLNLSGNLDLAQQSSTTTATSGQASGTTATSVSQAAIPTGAGKLSGITARYQFLNRFDPRSAKFKSAWASQVTSLKKNLAAITADTNAVSAVFAKHVPFSDSEADRTDLVQAAESKMVQEADADPSGKKLVVSFERFWQQVMTSDVMNDSNLASAVSKAVQDRAIYRQAWFNALDQAVGNLFTFEYDYGRPTNQPTTHDFKLIYAYNFQTMGMLTFNGAVSIYGSIPAGAKYGSLHYGQVSTEYDRTLSGKGKSTQTQLSIAGYWQYQPHPSILNIPAGTVAPGTDITLPNGTQEFVGTAGSLWVTQAKLTIKGTGGINIPIGVSWSNKTDLLQGSKVGGQVGISYNFSSLAGLFTGSSNQ